MKLAYVTDSLGYLPFTEMLDKAKSLGINYLEMATGGWSPAPHLDIDALALGIQLVGHHLADLDFAVVHR